jgi:acyl-CoA synthetase (AMP-forming)/AMP-acid ligase II
VSFGDGGLYLPGVAGVGRDEHHVRIRAMPGDRLPGGLPAVLVAGQQGQPPDPGVSERQGAGQVLPQVAPADMIQVQYTSGTTGFPKGAVLHHMGLVNEATFVAERAGMNDGGVCVNAMPIYHIGGGAVTSFGTWAKRGTFVILPGFEPGLLLEAFEAYSGTHTLVVPTMLIAMLDHPDLAKRDLSSLQTIMSGAASVPASLVRKTIGLLGCQFSILFGQTETHGVTSQTRVTDTPEDQAGTVGQPLPRLEVKIADMMTGGWLHMGDIGSMDERGFLRVTSRVKDMIIRGGMNLVLRRRAPHDPDRKDPEVRPAPAGHRRHPDLRRDPALRIRLPALAWVRCRRHGRLVGLC